MRVRVRGTKVLLKHTYIPRWFWVITILIIWNIIMMGMLVNILIMFVLLVIAIVVPLALHYIMSETYIITDKEVVIIKRGRIVKELRIDSTLVFNIRKERMYYFPLGRVLGDIVISKLSSSEPLLIIKDVPNPRDVLHRILKEVKRSR